MLLRAHFLSRAFGSAAFLGFSFFNKKQFVFTLRQWFFLSSTPPAPLLESVIREVFFARMSRTGKEAV